ncbi:hypothetical protein SNEBB_002322 [Seison nebaliae]|nr:hypothetical protein SNEBB_002322 [Seison nebaliae]
MDQQINQKNYVAEDCFWRSVVKTQNLRQKNWKDLYGYMVEETTKKKSSTETNIPPKQSSQYIGWRYGNSLLTHPKFNITTRRQTDLPNTLGLPANGDLQNTVQQTTSSNESKTETSPEIKFAQSLASNCKEQREQALSRTSNFLKTQKSITFVDLLKLWKGLYLALWQTDKPKTQEHLIENVSSLMKCFDSNLSFSILFYRAGIATISREWKVIDKWRTDKFLLLNRYLLKNLLDVFEMFDWNEHCLIYFRKILLIDLLNDYVKEDLVKENFNVSIDNDDVNSSKKLFKRHISDYEDYDEQLLLLHQNHVKTAYSILIHFLEIFLEELSLKKKVSTKISSAISKIFVEAISLLENMKICHLIEKNIFKSIIEQSDVGIPTEEEEKEEFNNLTTFDRTKIEKKYQNEDEEESSVEFDYEFLSEAFLEFWKKQNIPTKNKKILHRNYIYFKEMDNGRYPFAMNKDEYKPSLNDDDVSMKEDILPEICNSEQIGMKEKRLIENRMAIDNLTDNGVVNGNLIENEVLIEENVMKNDNENNEEERDDVTSSNELNKLTPNNIKGDGFNLDNPVKSPNLSPVPKSMSMKLTFVTEDPQEEQILNSLLQNEDDAVPNIDVAISESPEKIDSESESESESDDVDMQENDEENEDISFNDGRIRKVTFQGGLPQIRELPKSWRKPKKLKIHIPHLIEENMKSILKEKSKYPTDKMSPINGETTLNEEGSKIRIELAKRAIDQKKGINANNFYLFNEFIANSLENKLGSEDSDESCEISSKVFEWLLENSIDEEGDDGKSVSDDSDDEYKPKGKNKKKMKRNNKNKKMNKKRKS